MHKVKTRFAILVVAAIGAFGALALVYSSSTAAQAIHWTPNAIAETLKPGETKTLTATFTSQKPIRSASFRVTPSLEPYVVVDPPAVENVAAGQAVPVRIELAVPRTALPVNIDGVLQLRDSSRGNTIAIPLPMAIGVVWNQMQTASGVSLSYSTLGHPGDVVVAEDDGVTLLDVKIQLDALPFMSAYGIGVVPNASSTPLLTWFSQNVDVTGMLVGSQAFAYETLTNGGEALVLRGTVPDTHSEQLGPVAALYAISPTGKSIIVISTSHVLDLVGDAGASRNDVVSLFRHIATTIVVP
jgi:hypothetical protein